MKMKNFEEWKARKLAVNPWLDSLTEKQWQKDYAKECRGAAVYDGYFQYMDKAIKVHKTRRI
jgi:hypothetical protein